MKQIFNPKSHSFLVLSESHLRSLLLENYVKNVRVRRRLCCAPPASPYSMLRIRASAYCVVRSHSPYPRRRASVHSMETRNASPFAPCFPPCPSDHLSLHPNRRTLLGQVPPRLRRGRLALRISSGQGFRMGYYQHAKCNLYVNTLCRRILFHTVRIG